MPLVLVKGHDWRVYIACQKEDREIPSNFELFLYYNLPYGKYRLSEEMTSLAIRRVSWGYSGLLG
jgi:hypothetical protein